MRDRMYFSTKSTSQNTYPQHHHSLTYKDTCSSRVRFVVDSVGCNTTSTPTRSPIATKRSLNSSGNTHPLSFHTRHPAYTSS